MNSSKYILVTGGAGFIGSHTVVELYKNGYTPVIADDLRNADAMILDGLKKICGIEPLFHRTDICDKQALSSVFEKYPFQGIIHFAAYKAVGESVAEPLKYYQNNIGGLVNVLECALRFGVHDFVFSSSCTVYGDPGEEKEIRETTPLVKANSPYGNTKLIGEQILNDLHLSGSPMRIMSLRYFNPVGAHPSAEIGELPIGKPNNLLPFVTQTAIGKQEKLTVFGNDYPTKDGTCIRDYIHVCDLAEAHVKALDFLGKAENPINEQVNIGTGKGTSVLELIDAFEEISGVDLNWEFGPRRPGDVTEIYANVDKSMQILNWKTKFTMKDAVKDAWNWEKKLNRHAL
jgi:UDP-glucose 4-epimerase